MCVNVNMKIIDPDRILTKQFEQKRIGGIYLTWLKFNPSMYNFIHYKVWNEIIDNPFPNLNGCTVEVW